MEPSPVIYFDGVCNLCTGTVQFVLKRDKRKIFRFASLQGRGGSEMLNAHKLPAQHYQTFILEEGGKIFTRSTAALRVFKLLGGAWSLLYVFMIIPAFIRDAVYNFISNNRYRWFGKKEECWLPAPEWENRFIQ
jgi:predicted DCC family thiol-disulfide oxidoreductase YuxK